MSTRRTFTGLRAVATNAQAQSGAGELQALAPAPLYAQIKQILRSRVLDGTYQPHQQMPSESEMMAAFDVSRITVRQALSDLQNEGLIFCLHGKGTFVSKPKAFQDLGRLQGFGEAMRQMGYETFARVVSVRQARTAGKFQTRVHITFKDGTSLESFRAASRGMTQPLSNEEVVAKFRTLTDGLVERARQSEIERVVRSLDTLPDIAELTALLAPQVGAAFK